VFIFVWFGLKTVLPISFPHIFDARATALGPGKKTGQAFGYSMLVFFSMHFVQAPHM
jgi:hypothetical protein